MLSDAQVRGYLDRLGIAEAPEPTKENLDRLIYAHQTHIPFETVSVHRAQGAPDLSLPAIYDQVIDRRHGA